MAESKRAFYKTVVQVTVLSEDKPVKFDSLQELDFIITEGDCSGAYEVTSVERLTGSQMAKALEAQASAPSFFQLTPEEGEDTEL